MTKGKKIFLSIIAVIVIAVLSLVIFAHAQDDHKTPAPELSKWMSYIDGNTLVKNIAIPGAHDSGTTGMLWLGETQSKSTAEQLACGVRYFDIRTAIYNGRGGGRIYHGPLKGQALDYVLNDVKAFLDNNPTETVILDFQHFDNSGANEHALHDLLNDITEAKCLHNDTTMSDVEFIDTLKLDQARGKCIVFWGGGSDDSSKPYNTTNYVFHRNNDSGSMIDCAMQSYYETELNTMSSRKYVEIALPQYIASYRANAHGLFVLQGQLTDGLFVFGPRFREVSHSKNMNEYTLGLATSNNLDVINVIMRDFVSAKKCAIIINLNTAKNNVKADKQNDFDSLVNQYVMK